MVERVDKAISISGAMELYGEEANAARAASIESSINVAWSRAFPDGSSVACKITVTFRAPGSSAGNATQIEAKKISGPSHVSEVLTSRSMTLNANESDAFSWTPTHEFGHILGMTDRYSEGILSTVKGSWGGQRDTKVQTGYSGNIMAARGGAFEAKNLSDLAVESEPSTYWVNDDDQVRNWIGVHSNADIAKLSAANKLKAIQTIMGGWISDDDLNAIVRICASVTSGSDARTLRGGIDLLEINSIGQRTTVRLALSQMP